MEKSIVELLAERPEARVIVINRQGVATVLNRNVYWTFNTINPLRLQYDESWKAWTVRLAKGKYQQIAIFEPQPEVE